VKTLKVAVLYSGGKDSTYALWWALHQGWEVKYLVSVVPKNRESYMFHVPNVELTELISKSTGIPLVRVYTKGEKEKEVLDLKRVLEKLDIDGVVSGAIASEYQRRRIDHICEELGVRSFAPLWHKDQELILRDAAKFFEFKIVSVSAYGLSREYLGKTVDESNVHSYPSISILINSGLYLSRTSLKDNVLILYSIIFLHPMTFSKESLLSEALFNMG